MGAGAKALTVTGAVHDNVHAASRIRKMRFIDVVFNRVMTLDKIDRVRNESSKVGMPYQ